MHQQPACTRAMDTAGQRRLLRWRSAALITALVLAGCGGGGGGDTAAGDTGTGSAPGTPGAPPAVVATLRPEVKSLAAPQAAEVVVAPDGTVSVPASLGLRAGEVLMLPDRVVKLGPQGVTSPDGRRVSFEHQEPALDEVYSSIVLNGSSDGLQPEQLSEAPGGPNQRALAWTPDSGNACKPASGQAFGSSGTAGLTCTYNAQDKATDPTAKRPSVDFRSQLTVGARWQFRNYDVIRRKGTATLSFESDGQAVLQIGANTAFGTLGPLAESSACTSGLNNSLRQVTTTGRVRIGTLSWLLGTSGFRLNVPLCLAIGARGSASWEIFRVTPSLRYTVQFQDDLPPTVSVTPGVGRIDNPDRDAVFDFNPSGTAVSDMGMAVAGELAFEASVELSDAFRVVGVGLENRFVGRVGAEGRLAAAVIGNSVGTGELQASPLACIRWTAGGDVELNGYLWTARSRKLAAKLLLHSQKLGEVSQRYGLCLRSTAAVRALTVPETAEPGQTIAVSAAVAAAPTRNEVVYAEPPGGELQFLDQRTGELLCQAVVGANGQAACSFAAPVARSYQVVARYGGDERHATADSQTAPLEVKRAVYPTVAWLTPGPSPAMSTRFTVRVTPANVSTALAVTGQVSFREADSGQVLCVQSLDAQAQAQCDVAFAVGGPRARRVVAVYSGNADFKASTSAEVVHDLGGAFTIDISALGTNPQGVRQLQRCQNFTSTASSGAFSGSGQVTNDVCTTDVGPYLRCLGTGCGNDRLMVTAWHLRTVSTMGCFPVPGNFCSEGQVVTTEDRWADATANYVSTDSNPPRYQEGQDGGTNLLWAPLAENAWQTPLWGGGAGTLLLSNRGAIAKNYVATGDIQPGWYRNVGDWKRHEHLVEYLVYDRLEQRYTTVTYRFVLE